MRTRWTALLAVLAATLILAPSAGADTVQVDSNDDDFDAPGCSLRDAIGTHVTEVPQSDCSLVTEPGTDTITFAPSLSGATITLVGQLQISSPMNIVGPGMNELTISADSNSRVFLITHFVEISGLTMTEGVAPGDAPDGHVRGGCVFAGLPLTLRAVRVTDCAATISGTIEQFADGGGIYNASSLTLEDSVVSGNTVSATNTAGDGTSAQARGGGVYSDITRPTTIIDSTISGNTASAEDDGLGSARAVAGAITLGDLTMSGSTVSGNDASASQSGGGQAFSAGGLQSRAQGTIERSTIADNVSDLNGTDLTIPTGVLVQAGTGELAIRSSTIALNGPTVLTDVDGVNLFLDAGGAATLTNTIVADPLGDGENCFGAINTGGFNVDFSPAGASCFTAGEPTDLTSDPLLSPAGLAGNGGPTETLALQPTSPAIDQGSGAGDTNPTEDQRGLTRPALFSGIPDVTGGNGADIGAYEVQLACAGQPTPGAACPPPSGGGSTPLAPPTKTGKRAKALKKCKNKEGKKRKKCVKRAKKKPA
jgi:hypothetical protein